MRARVLPIGAMVFVAIALSAPFAGAQTPVVPPIKIDVGNWDLRRNVELVAAGADLVHAATEVGLGKVFETASTSADRRGRLFRIGKLYLVDLPTVAVAHTLGHEFGHTSRLRENQIPNHGFRLTNWPWPVPFVDAVGKAGFVDSFFDPRALSVASGGFEAGRVRDRRFDDDFSGRSGVDYFSAARLIYSRLEEPLAAMVYLRESKIRNQDVFYFGGLDTDDMRQYATTFTGVRHVLLSLGDAQQTARQIRADAPWALADLQLWGSFYRVANYLWTGKAVGEVPAVKFGDNRLWPRATFALTPVGIARGAELLWARTNNSVKVSAEKTEQAIPLDVIGLTDRGRPILADRTPSLWGGRVTASTRRNAFALRLDTSLWNQSATGRGGAVEARIERPLTGRAARTSASVSLGYKTAGFLAGAPDGARWFGSIGFTIRPTQLATATPAAHK